MEKRNAMWKIYTSLFLTQNCAWEPTQKCFEWNERARETGEIIQLSSAIADDDKDDDDDDVALERPKILWICDISYRQATQLHCVSHVYTRITWHSNTIKLFGIFNRIRLRLVRFKLWSSSNAVRIFPN